ncbi:MAG TPA: hypothetical protein P5279_17140, partial [Anaerohalosphaeraceae bacterium]|nr:hypothetical protein [Anaerohalosphaeraceae bacterium]
GTNEGGAGAVRVWDKGWNWAYSSWEDLWNRGILTHNGGQKGAFADNFVLGGDLGVTLISTDFGGAYNPFPGNRDKGVALDVSLSWEPVVDVDNPTQPNAEVTRHFLFMNDPANPEDPNFYYIAEIVNSGQRAEYGPLSLDRDQEVKWYIEEGIADYPPGDPNNIKGSVWSFKTLLATPMIDTQPVNVLAVPGDSAVFNVSARNPFTDPDDVSYQWYIAADPPVSIAEGGKYLGASTSTLTILDPQLGDENWFFCRITNTSGNDASVDSDTVALTVKGLIGHWEFNDPVDPSLAIDSSVYGNHAAIVEAQYVEGGSALEFNGLSSYVDVPAAALAPVTTQISILFWQNGAATQPVNNVVFNGVSSSGHRVVSSHLPWSDGIVYWDGGTGTGSEPGVAYDRMDKNAQPAEYKGAWNQWAFVKNVDTGAMTIYLNGRLWHSATQKSFSLGRIARFSIGCGLQEQTLTPHLFYPGKIKDFRIYNYAIDAEEVAGLYYDATGEFSCANPPAHDVTGPEGVPDCIVNLFDYAQVVAGWAECGLFPTCIDSLTVPVSPRADTVIWDGQAGNRLMETATNWDNDTVPAIVGENAGDSFVVIDNGDAVTTAQGLYIAHDGAVTGGLAVLNGSSVSTDQEIALGCGGNFSGGQTGATGTITIGPGSSVNVAQLIWVSVEPGNTFNIDFVGGGGSFDPGTNEGGAGAVRVWDKGWNWAYSSWEDLWNRGILTHNGVQTGTFADNFILTGDLGVTLVSTHFGGAHDPYPANGAKDVPTVVTLAWEPAVDPNNPAQPHPHVTRHFLFMNDPTDSGDPNLYYAAEIDNDGGRAEYGPLTLERDQQVKWRVEQGIADYAPGDPNNIDGPVWSFSTAPSTPVIETQPVGLTVDVGADAVFAVSARNPFTGSEDVSYGWYLATDPATPLADGSKYAGTATSTLTVFDVQLADQNKFFCRVTNTAGNAKSADSNVVKLAVQSLVGHWPFDGDLNDVQGANHGSAADPAYTAGAVDGGQAITFSGDTSAVVTIPVSTDIASSWTFAWWDMASAAGAGAPEEAMLGNGPTVGSEVFEFNRHWTVRYGFGFNQRDLYTTPTDTLYPRGQWVFHVVAYDADVDTANWYINGRKVHTFGNVGISLLDPTLFVGNIRDLTQPLKGAIDDLRLYNYPFTDTDALLLYTNVAGPVCIDQPHTDLDNDCVTGLSDLAMIASEWLACGIYPSEACF